MSDVRTCDVLVIGAGPAGSAAGRALARDGWQVTIVDRREFPREKVCGDALIADSLASLDALGIRDRVLQGAVSANELRVYPPNGRFVPLQGRFACLTRADLDTRLLDAATGAGATFLPGVSATGPLLESDRIEGAMVDTPGGPLEIRARMTLLATGANTVALAAFGLDVPLSASAVAGRAYFEAPPDVAARFRHLTIAYDDEWCPGYGWIFPGPARRFNIGVGIFPGRHAARRLREFWRAFTTRFEPAAAIVRASTARSAFRGATLRTGLTRARFGSPGLLVVGEAAAMTYPATGEGIGKAMESGLLAASFVADVFAGRRQHAALHDEYGNEFRRRYLSRYRAYRVAETWAAHPIVLNLLAARANAGRFVRREIEALVDERGDPNRLFSARGLLTALVR